MAGSAAFELLHPVVQKWIWSHQWTRLRDAQERAVAPILAGDRDVIIAATTASGKTEAAFLPICSALLESDQPTGIQALYVSPLKALINDQYGRLDELCEGGGIAIHRWHGDVPGAKKHKLLSDPSGILLITPESLEALFVVHGAAIRNLFGALRYVVVDEIHTFIGTERGAQLQSLLHRVDLSIRRRVPRIGLSATLGDMTSARDWLRPSNGERVEVIIARDGESEIKLQVRGVLETPPEAARHGTETEAGSAVQAIAGHLFTTHRGSDGLVFANSRASVEELTDLLTRRSERERVPDEFVPHHGNLSRAIREHVEARLKQRDMPVTAVCTSTLEMGIDIGSVAAVSQVGPPPSVSSLRQRLGRSGRRGDAAVLRAYVVEQTVTERTPLIDQLRLGLLQTIAMVELLLRGWCESPDNDSLHLSTLVQQILSLIAQHGGVKPQEVYSGLCGHGPFSAVSPSVFAALLRSLGKRDLITQQASDGLLLLGQAGERHVNHYTFYTAFQTAEEYRLIAESRVLGTMPINFPISEGTLIIFAGQRWKITAIDDRDKTIELARSSGGRPPHFTGGLAPVSDVVRREMRSLYLGEAVHAYLDHAAQQLLAEGRRNFARYCLASNSIHPAGDETHLVVWRGDRVVSTIATALAGRGLETVQHAAVVTVSADETTLRRAIGELASQPPPDAMSLAASVRNKTVDKWDGALDEDLLTLSCASRDFDVDAAWHELALLADGGPRNAGG